MKKFLSLITVFALVATTVLPTFAQYWGGGRSSSINSGTSLLVRDTCPDGDFSGSLYDDECDADDERLDDGGSIVDGYVFFDDNNNGSFDSNEDAVPSAVVTLLVRSTREILGTDVTNSRGYYEFINVQPGEYTISVRLSAQEVSFISSLVAFFVPTVNAQADFEFNLDIESDWSIVQKDFAVERDVDTTNGVSSVDGGNTADDITDPVVDDAMMDDTTTPTTTNILDGIGSLDVDVPMVNATTNDNFALPTTLPNTWARI